MARVRKNPWYEDLLGRVRFERGARSAVTRIQEHRVGKGRKAEIVYQAIVEVPEYEARRIKIRIADVAEPVLVGVTVDGPDDSPHRFSDGRLCMWHPDDGPEARWTPDEGLLRLIRYIQLHLFREAWWRETGEWLGPEAEHTRVDGKAA